MPSKNTIKYIGLDFVGSLFDRVFDNIIWQKKFPLYYSKKNLISIKESESFIFSEFYRAKFIEIISKEKWNDIDYWFERFNLVEYRDDLVKELKEHSFLFLNVREVLKKLKQKGYKLILITTFHTKILEIKLDSQDLRIFFDKIYSPSFFNLKKKSILLYKNILNDLNIKPEELAYIGTNFEEDYKIPKAIGINAYYLTKDEEKKYSKHFISDLKEFEEKI